MNKVINDFLKSLHFGNPKSFRHLTLLPVFSKLKNSLNCISMAEAMKHGLLEVKEVDESGSVPHLVVINKAEFDVLLIDGEEVVGAKQNRIVNSSVLIGAGKKVKIPVSCTEQGRWGYSSTKDFVDSKVVMPKRIRMEKGKDVHANLKKDRGYASDQGKVWDEIREFEIRHETHSRTGAMKDVFEEKKDEMREFLRKCKPEKGQIGIMAFYKGTPIGLEFVSSPDVYKDLHNKLITSYAIDTLPKVSGREEEVKVVVPSQFVERIMNAEETKYDSVDLGQNFRYEEGSITGSVLVHEKEPVHGVFFNDEEESSSAPRRRM